MPTNLLLSAASIFLLAFAALNSARFALSWGNGGYSVDPSSSAYGTYDWIAQHAVAWLPMRRKQFLVNKMPGCFYGTELLDDGIPVGGIGETTKHHSYIYSNSSLQDDSSTAITKEEYLNARTNFRTGNLSAVALLEFSKKTAALLFTLASFSTCMVLFYRKCSARTCSRMTINTRESLSGARSC